MVIWPCCVCSRSRCLICVHRRQGSHCPAIPANSCNSCKFLQIPAIPANSCKNSCKFLHFAVVAGIQLSVFTNLFDIYILIIYLKVLICIFYCLISFSVMKIGKFEILNFFEKKLDLENFSTYFFEKKKFFCKVNFFCILTYKDVPK